MIELSIDRLAQIYKYDVPDDIESSEYSQLVISLWIEKIRKILRFYVPGDLTIISSGNGYSVQFYFEKKGTTPESILNVSVQQYVDGIRLDFNPKRVRQYFWLKSVMADIKEFAIQGGYKAHNTQVDLAIDLFNEGAAAANFTINKPGVKRTGLFNSVSGDIQTQYFGVRGSSAFVRIYNKHDEQVAQLSKKYRKLRALSFKKYDDMMSEINSGNLNSNDVIDTFKQYSFDSSPFYNRDFTKKDEFEAALNWALGELREQEESKIPFDWKRLEIVLRTEKLSDDRVTFDDVVVYDYINSITNTELSTISDYNLRALALGIESGQVQVSELSHNEKARYRKILKYDEIVVFKTVSSGAQRIMSIDDFVQKIDPLKVTSEKHITKKSETSLRDKIRNAFDLSKNDLKSELISYTL